MELKATTIYDAYWKATCNGDNSVPVYIKSEADKVIAELEKRIVDGDNDFEMANHQNERLLKIVRHHKYKRCLAMALVWFERAENSTDWKNELVSRKRFSKWMELAEKFKEAK